MGATIWTCIRQAVWSKKALLSIVVIALVVLFGSFETMMDVFRSQDLVAYGTHGNMILSALDSDAMTLVLPIFCALPYAASYVDDLKTGYIRHFVRRTPRRAYAAGKVAGCIVSGGLVVVAGIWLAYAIAACLFLPREAAPAEGTMSTVLAAGQIFRRCGLFFLSGGFWCLFGMALSAGMESRYIAYASPFIFYYVLIILHERYLEGLYVIYPKDWLSPGDEWAFGAWGAALVVLEIMCVTGLLFGLAVRRRTSRL